MSPRPKPEVLTADDRPASSRAPTGREPESVAAPSSTALAAASRRATPGPGPETADAAERAREADKIREMLDSPHLRRIFIVTDVLGGGTRDLVEDLVQKTPRTEASYARIVVSQGIVIDPRHPNEATVFALVMNEQEQRNFQRSLEQSFPRRVEDAEADPALVTQLADIGQMSVRPGSPAAEVLIPTDLSPQVALRSDPGPHGEPQVKRQISPDIDIAADAGLGHLGDAEVRAARELTGNPESLSRKRASGSVPSPLLARGDDRPPTPPAAPEAGVVPAGPRADLALKARGLRPPPAIVLVWVTAP